MASQLSKEDIIQSFSTLRGVDPSRVKCQTKCYVRKYTKAPGVVAFPNLVVLDTNVPDESKIAYYFLTSCKAHKSLTGGSLNFNFDSRLTHIRTTESDLPIDGLFFHSIIFDASSTSMPGTPQIDFTMQVIYYELTIV